MGYFQHFGSKCGRHRDGFDVADLAAYYRDGTNPFLSNPFPQTRGTNTLIYTLGDTPMEMRLSFPEKRSPACAMNSKEYVCCPSLVIPLTHGTLLIFDPLDDLFFCHEVAFTALDRADAGSASGFRLAWVFRWLNASHRAAFFHSGTMRNHKKPTPEAVSRNAPLPTQPPPPSPRSNINCHSSIATGGEMETRGGKQEEAYPSTSVLKWGDPPVIPNPKVTGASGCALNTRRCSPTESDSQDPQELPGVL